MEKQQLDIVILGLTITSSWGNGHASTYRALMRELVRRGHRVLFLERDKPWYAAHRDLSRPPYGRTKLYSCVAQLQSRYAAVIRKADAVILGSYVPEGVEIADWLINEARGVTAFYDIDTPVTVAKLRRRDFEYLHTSAIPQLDLYLSFTGGPLLACLEREFNARRAVPLYCCVDADQYRPTQTSALWQVGYLGTYSEDRQPALERRLLDAARCVPDARFAVAGSNYPADVDWPPNVTRIDHLAPAGHPRFYAAQRYTLNLTRADMLRAGYSPSVRLFEAAACATPILTDRWAGLNEFFKIGSEILTVESSDELIDILQNVSENQRLEIGRRARQRVLREHSSARRALELERYLKQAIGEKLAPFQALRSAPGPMHQQESPNGNGRAKPAASPSGFPAHRPAAMPQSLQNSRRDPL